MTTQVIAPNLSIWQTAASVPRRGVPFFPATIASMITLPIASTIAIAKLTGSAQVVKSFLSSARASRPVMSRMLFMRLSPD